MGTLKRTGNNVLTRVLVIAFVVSFLIFFFDNVQTTYNSYVDLEKEIENNKLEKQIIENQIEEWIHSKQTFSSKQSQGCQFHRVSKLVNSPKNNNEACVKPG